MRIIAIFCFSILFVNSIVTAKTGRTSSVVNNKKKIQQIESNLPPDKKWKLVWDDEFDGNILDTTKWGFRLHIMQTRHETWTEDGVELDGKGNLLLKVYEKDGKFYSTTLQTGSNYLDRPGNRHGNSKLFWPVAKIETPKFMHNYGYYEIRCKLPKEPGWWPAFWIQSPCIGSTLDPSHSGVEIDIMEYFKRDGRTRSAVLWNGYGPDARGACSGDHLRPGITEGYHTFGVDWSAGKYIFYIDGKEHWRFDGPVSDVEGFILISTECNGVREGKPSPELQKAQLPDYFVVDYVRVYDEISDNTKNK